MADSFSQFDLEKISAWMDGELASEQEREVRQRVGEDQAWARGYRQFREVDDALSRWEIPATFGSKHLAARIIRNSRPKNLLLLAVRWAAPLGVAAIVVVMILSMLQQGKSMRGRGASTASIQQRSRQTRPDAVRYMVPNARQQARLLENYSRKMQFTQQWMARNEWLLIVLSSFTPQELTAMKNLSHDEGTKRIIQRRDELVRQGTLRRVANPR